MKPLYWVALVLVIVGAINWGLIGFFQFDLVAALFGGSGSALSRIVYSLVGLSGLVLAVMNASLPNGVRSRNYRNTVPVMPTR